MRWHHADLRCTDKLPLGWHSIFGLVLARFDGSGTLRPPRHAHVSMAPSLAHGGYDLLHLLMACVGHYNYATGLQPVFDPDHGSHGPVGWSRNGAPALTRLFCDDVVNNVRPASLRLPAMVMLTVFWATLSILM